MSSMKITAQFLSRNWDRDIGEIERQVDDEGNIIPITKNQKEKAGLLLSLTGKEEER